jgi:hypothetical protein
MIGRECGRWAAVTMQWEDQCQVEIVGDRLYWFL